MKEERKKSAFCNIKPLDLNADEWLKLINRAIKICGEWQKDIMEKEYLPCSGIVTLDYFISSQPKSWGPVVYKDMELPWKFNFDYYSRKWLFPNGLNEDIECFVLAFNVNERSKNSMTYNVFLMSLDPIKLVYCKAKFKLNESKIEGFFKFSFVSPALLDRLDDYRELGQQITERLEDLLRINTNTLISKALKMRDSAKELNMLWRGFYLHRD